MNKRCANKSSNMEAVWLRDNIVQGCVDHRPDTRIPRAASTAVTVARARVVRHNHNPTCANACRRSVTKNARAPSVPARMATTTDAPRNGHAGKSPWPLTIVMLDIVANIAARRPKNADSDPNEAFHVPSGGGADRFERLWRCGKVSELLHS